MFVTYQLSPTAVPGQSGQYLYPGKVSWISWNGPFGGALLGSMMESMEQSSGQGLVAIMAQFLKPAKHGPELVFQVETLAAGKAVAQMRGSAMQEGQVLFTATATLAASGDKLERVSSSVMPVVPPPDASPARTYMRPIDGGLNDTVDVRIAAVDAANVRLWARCPDAGAEPLTPGLLAAFADHPPFGVTLLRGAGWFGLTLDSTLRIVSSSAELSAASWVLVDIGFEAMGTQMGFATVNLWTSTGQLLAIGSQTLRVRNGIPASRS
jgi:acyl-CoA thioesterase